MRASLVSLLPMLAAAVLVMVGGERMARRVVESRTPADRSRLLDLDAAFRAELARLDGLYQAHIQNLVRAAALQKAEEIKSFVTDLSGVRLIRVFHKNNKDFTIQPDGKGSQLPEIELSKGKRLLNPNTALILDSELLDRPAAKEGTWLATSEPELSAYYRQAEPGVLVVILVDRKEVQDRTAEHLTSWLKTALTPLREAGERLLIERPDGLALASLGPAQHGPAASIIPIRSLFGNWQIRSWDGLVVTQSHDPATLAVATALAILLAASGVVLMLQQKRALRLAAERVSFVNRVSHEFGAPLTNLSLNLDLATDYLTTRPDEARRRLGLVAEEIQRLSRLVANVLTFSCRERDSLKLKPEPCIPDDVVRSVIESFRPSLERRGIEIIETFSANQPVLLDPDALSQITGNLISNVEKYAASGKWLGVECRLESDVLIMEVHDRGDGIPASEHQRVFAPFERVLQATNEGASGTGLGLSIGRDLAQRMGGDLKLLECEQGSCFQLRIPAPPALALVSHNDAA